MILDVKMPGLDGLQVLGLIRQRSNIPVIMLTGGHEKNTVSDALNLGADDYMRKPFSGPELIARIKTKLKRAGQ